MALKLTGNLTRKRNMLEYTVLRPPGLWDRGGSCPRAVAEGQRAVAELSAAAAQAQLESAPPSPAPPTSAGGEGENIENLSLSANKSMQVRLQGNLRRSLRRERPDGAGAAATAPARRKSSWSCFPGGRRP